LKENFFENFSNLTMRKIFERKKNEENFLKKFFSQFFEISKKNGRTCLDMSQKLTKRSLRISKRQKSRFLSFGNLCFEVQKSKIIIFLGNLPPPK